ncbi:hypothetical protein ACSBR1_005534 [Camellia fascicularis]
MAFSNMFIPRPRSGGSLAYWIINPLVFGDYPKIVKKNAGSRIPEFTKVESKLVKGSFDFLGVNHYNTLYIKDKPSSLKINRDFNADMAVDIIRQQTRRNSTLHDSARVNICIVSLGVCLML